MLPRYAAPRAAAGLADTLALAERRLAALAATLAAAERADAERAAATLADAAERLAALAAAPVPFVAWSLDADAAWTAGVQAGADVAAALERAAERRRAADAERRLAERLAAERPPYGPRR